MTGYFDCGLADNAVQNNLLSVDGMLAKCEAELEGARTAARAGGGACCVRV